MPSRIGPYRLEAEIGVGGLSEVYKAVDERLDRLVAVKHIHSPKTLDGSEHEALWREARAVARLSHPAIVQVFDIVEDDTGSWIVMELVDGRTLARLLEEGPLAITTALRLFAEVAEGLAEAHDKGLLHRDLKAENLMVTAAGHAKLLDFGLAQNLEPSTVGETPLAATGGTANTEPLLVGTPSSMSPEQTLGLELDRRSDLFSLGTLIYEAITGQKAFHGKGLVATLHKVCFAQQRPAHELNPRVPEELSKLVDRLLEKDQQERPRDGREVARALRLIFPAAASLSPPRHERRSPISP